MKPTLVVVTGPTASGKTSLAISLAERLGCDIISADSRQIYKDIPIGTAAPTPEERARVCHHLVGTLPLDAYYSAARFESDALGLLGEQWRRGRYAIVCGGSMMYVDALTDGIDELPDISAEVRRKVAGIRLCHGAEGLVNLLEIVDPAYHSMVDLNNLRRVEHALEICLQTGRPYSALREGRRSERPFRIVKIAIDRPREELFGRINARVDQMMAEGLEEEARRVYPLRHFNSLNTVGFKEMFAMLDGEMDRETAVARIAKNTRVYAKKQLTWLKRAGVRPTVMLAPDTACEQALEIIRKEE